jgi:hypothetical protein
MATAAQARKPNSSVLGGACRREARGAVENRGAYDLRHLFRTNHHPCLTMDANRKAVDVALATAAAPTYFSAATVGGCQYVDGGVWANNPVMASVVEATAWLRVPLNRIDVLSVGTTADLIFRARDARIRLGWLWKARILGLLMHAQGEGAAELAGPLLGSVRLLRLDQAVLPGAISLDGVDRIPDLVDYGREVARHPNTMQQVRARFLNGCGRSLGRDFGDRAATAAFMVGRRRRRSVAISMCR